MRSSEKLKKHRNNNELSNRIGEVSKQMVLLDLFSRGYKVARSCVYHQPWDFAIEKDGKFKTVKV